MGDIVVGDIINHNVTSVQNNIKILWKKKKKATCGTVVGQCHQPQCHPSATRKIDIEPRKHSKIKDKTYILFPKSSFYRSQIKLQHLEYLI